MDETKPTYEELAEKLARVEELISLTGNGFTSAPDDGGLSGLERGSLQGARALKEAYIESEQNFRNSMDACPLGVRIITADGECFYANQAILDICGYATIEQLNAVPIEQLYTPESYDDYLERKRKRQRGEYVFPEYVIGVRRPDGAVRTLQVFWKEINWGGRQQFMAMYQDVTERLQAEKSLIESRELFARVFRASPVLMLITTEKDGSIVEVNDYFCKTAGYSRDELLGRTTPELKLWHKPEHRAAILDFLKEKETASGVEVEMRTKNGDIRIVNMSLAKAALKNEPCLITIAEDITNRKKAREELIIQRDFSQSMFRTAPIIMLTLQPDGRILTFNPYMEEISGYRLEEVKDKSWFDVFIPERDRARIKEYFLKTITKADSKGNINPVLTKDGRELEIEWYNKTLKDPEGNIVRLLAVGQDVTERRKLEASIRYHARLVQSVSDAIISSDAEFRLLSWNRAAEEMYGWTEQEVIGKTVMEVTRPVFINTTSQEILNSLRKNGSWKGEAVHHRRDGKKINVLMSISLMRNEAGNETGAVTVLKDITEHRKAEMAVHESEERFRRIFEAGPLGILLHDLDYKFTMMNARFCELYGYTEAELKMLGLPDVILEEDFRKILPNLQKLAQGELQYYSAELKNRKKSGEIFWSDVTVTLLRDSAGKPQGFLSLVQNITPRKQAGERIHHLNLTLRSIRNVSQLIKHEKTRDRLIKGICDALVVGGSFKRAWIILFNDARQPVTWAVTPTSDGFMELVESFKMGNMPSCIRKALVQKKVIVTRYPHEQCPGCPMLGTDEGNGSLTARLELGGKNYGILYACMPRDLLSGEEEKALFDEVAGDIAFALRDIELEAANELLKQERLRAAKLESIGTLAGGIAHDFNNLLTGIMGNIGLAKTCLPPSGTIFELLDDAEKAAARSRDLTQQLLTFARGGKPIKKLTDIAAVVRESATFALRGSKVRLDLSLPDDLWLAEVDEGQISQVIHNLVINADEAMPRGGVLKISARNIDIRKTISLPLPGGKYLQVDIADSGEGISPEHLQTIFEPYFTTKPHGSGLGLTSAYSIIKNHGGSLLAESVLNRGSVFHIYLPASKKTRKGEKKVTAARSAQAGGKVLVMDDDETIRKMLKNMLNLAGYEVELSADGVEALEKYRRAMEARDPFTTVIMDLTIPGGMGGKEAVKNLLEIDPSAVVIVSSGYATDPIMSEYKKYGFSAVIAKPYSIKQLQETITGVKLKNKK